MRPAGLDISGRPGQIVDGVRPADLSCEPRVDLTVVIAGVITEVVNGDISHGVLRGTKMFSCHAD